MKAPTVYSTVAKDGTLRMSLHPMSSAPKVWRGNADCAPRTFRKRVVWPFYGEWYPSCRGAGYYSDDADAFLDSSGTIDDAFKFLLKGEK